MMSGWRERRGRWFAPAAVCLLLLSLIGLMLAGPSNIHEKEQPGTTAFMADVADNGAWLVQERPNGAVATKPPLLHWAGGLSIRILGGSELALKLPGVLCFLGLCLVVHALARDDLGAAGAWVAVACFASVNPVFKLANTARPDMPVALWLGLALLASMKQRRAWAEGRRSSPAWVAIFWGATALAMLTKGQLALIAILWLALLVAAARAISGVPLPRSRPLLQTAGLIASLALFGAWFWAAWRASPEFSAMLEQEVVSRTTRSDEFLQGRTPQPWNVPFYVLSRFAPWSVLLVVTAAMLGVAAIHRRTKVAQDEPQDRRHPPPRVAWALGYVGLVVGALMTQPTHRPDHLLPAYPAAAVLAAAAAVHASRFRGPHRAVTAVVIGAVALGGVAAPVLLAFAPEPTLLSLRSPGDAPPARAAALALDGATPAGAGALIAACVVAVAGGVVSAVSLRRGAWLPASLGAALAMGGLVGLNKMTLSEEARSRLGDAQVATVRMARAAAAELGEPIEFFDTGYTGLQPLSGRNDPEDAAHLAMLAERPEPTVLVTRAEHEARVRAAAPGRAELLYRIGPASKTAGPGTFLIFRLTPGPPSP